MTEYAKMLLGIPLPPKKKRTLTGYARYLIWKSEGAVSYTLRPPSKYKAKAERRTRSRRNRK